MKLVIVQRFVPLYDVPLFEAIASKDGIELTVLADLQSRNQLNQYDPAKHKFEARHVGSRRLDPDAVILSGDPREIYQCAAVFWCRLRGIPVGLWSIFHRIGPKRFVTEVYMYVAGRAASVLMSYGERGRSEMVRRGVNPGKIVVLSTAIDERKVMAARDSVSPSAIARFKAEQGLDGRRVLLHVARLTATKRPDFMLESFRRLLEAREDVLLVWIGGGPLEQEIQKRARELGIAGYMRFLGPIYEERALAPWYLSADVFVMATGLGLSVHHAMCYGLPVVTDNDRLTQVSEFEVLADGVNGLTYRSGDASDFAAKVGRLLDNEELRTRMSAAARRRIECEFTLENKLNNFGRGIDRLFDLSRLARRPAAAAGPGVAPAAKADSETLR
jgi:glycosyltransferase involved in cell wall biosynthesis